MVVCSTFFQIGYLHVHLQGHTSPLTSVAHNASDRVVVSGAQNGWLLMHNVGSGQMINLTKDEPFNQVRYCIDKAVGGLRLLLV